MSEVVDALKKLIAAIDSKWKKTPPPRKLVEPLEEARKLVG